MEYVPHVLTYFLKKWKKTIQEQLLENSCCRKQLAFMQNQKIRYNKP